LFGWGENEATHCLASRQTSPASDRRSPFHWHHSAYESV
jgi:hypothetical protein